MIVGHSFREQAYAHHRKQTDEDAGYETVQPVGRADADPEQSRGEAPPIDANTPQRAARFQYKPNNIGHGV